MVSHKQQGMALLMALVMMAMAVTLATGLWYSSRLSLFRTHHSHQNLQAQHLSRGLLLWAGDILEQDYAETNQTYDTHHDAWQQGISGMVVEQAVLSGELAGMNHLFNINNLVINNQVSQVHVDYFNRLLEALHLDVHMTDKIIDWIDVDQQPRPGGAEDFAYAAQNPPYQTAGAPFNHVNELRLIAGLDDAQFEQLSAYVTALPVNNRATLMNINTIPPVMISALDPAISEELAIRIHQQGQASFTQVDDFYQFDDELRFLPGLKDKKPLINQLIGVQTRWLQARTEVVFGEHRYQQYALLRRDDSGAGRVLMRSPIPFLP